MNDIKIILYDASMIRTECSGKVCAITGAIGSSLGYQIEIEDGMYLYIEGKRPKWLQCGVMVNIDPFSEKKVTKAITHPPYQSHRRQRTSDKLA